MRFLLTFNFISFYFISLKNIKNKNYFLLINKLISLTISFLISFNHQKDQKNSISFLKRVKTLRIFQFNIYPRTFTLFWLLCNCFPDVIIMRTLLFLLSVLIYQKRVFVFLAMYRSAPCNSVGFMFPQFTFRTP